MGLRICCPILKTTWACADFSGFLVAKKHSPPCGTEKDRAKNKTFSISSPSFCFAIIFSKLLTGEWRLFFCGFVRHISLPLIAFRLEPHALSCVCATANVCLRVKECKPPLLISLLHRSHRAEEWEAEKKERIMMREKHSSRSPVHPHCSVQHSSSALLSCLSSEPHANV